MHTFLHHSNAGRALRARIMLLFLACLLAGCSMQAWIDRIASPAEQARARSHVDALRARDFDAVERALREDLRTPELQQALERMAAMVPAGALRSVTVVSAQKKTGGGASWLALGFEYEFAGGWMVANVTTEERDGARSVIAFHVTPRSQSLEDEHRFVLDGKTPLHYAVLAAALLSCGVTLLALVRCVRTKGLARKWLWLLFILFGVGKFGMDWSSGAWHFQTLHLLLFGASYMAPFGAAPVLAVSLPLGAIVFLLRRRNGTLPMKKRPGAGEPPAVTPDPGATAQAPRR